MGSLGRYMRRNTAAVCAWFASKKKLAHKISTVIVEVHDTRRRLLEEQNTAERAGYANQSLSEEIRKLQIELTKARDEIACYQARVDLLNLAYGHNRELVKQAISTAGGQLKDVDRKSFRSTNDGELAS